MRSPAVTFLALTFFLVSGSRAFAQEMIDTTELSKAGKAAKADELYFEALKMRTKDDPRMATELLQKFIVLRPDVSAAYYELAKLNAESKKLDQAESNVKKALELQPANKWYKELYASIYVLGGKYDKAAELAAQLADAQTQDDTYPLMAAEYYERARKYNDAVKYIDLALQRNGSDEDVMMRKVQLYLTMNDAEKAAETIRQMIAREPKNGRLYKLLGQIYDNNKLTDKASEVYQKAQKLLPNDPAVQLGMAEHYLKTGDTVAYKKYVHDAVLNNNWEVDEQVELLRAFVQSQPSEAASVKEGMPLIRELARMHPNEAPVLSFYGDFLDANGQNDSAAVMYKRALELKPSDFEVWKKLLGNMTERKDADTLLKYSEKAIRLFPNQALAHYFNGIARSNRKEYPQAAKALNRAIDMQPDSNRPFLAAMYSMLGDIYNSMKDFDKSDKAFDKALDLDPNDASVLNNYSYFLSVRGKKLDDAERMSAKSLELRPNEATFLDTYGWILYRKGQYSKALESIQKAVDLSADRADATLYEHLGDVYYKLNNKDKALENWKIAKTKGGDDPQLDKKINEGKLYE